MIISGRPPFNAHKVQDLIEKIKKGSVKYEGSVWKNVSAEVKDLIQGMLTVDHNKRYSAQQVIDHPWMQAHSNNALSDIPLCDDALSNLLKYNAENVLSASIFSFITNQLTNSKEEKELEKIFKKVDKNKDGKLSLEEIENGYKKLKLGSNVDVKQIFAKTDTDGSGFIEYSEFMTASRNWKSTIEKEGLEKAFNSFDVGADGQLSLQDLKNSLPSIEGSEWVKFFEIADTNKDGLISYEELKDYLIQKT